MKRGEVAGERKVRKTNKTRGSPVAKTTEPHRRVFHLPGFLRLVDRAGRARLVQQALKGARYTQAVRAQSISTHAVPFTYPKARLFRTEKLTARGERKKQPAYTCSAARELVGQLFRNTVSTITAPPTVT